MTLLDRVHDSLAPATRDEFERRVDEQADWLRGVIRDGDLDQPSFGVGVELEAYATAPDGRLARLPRAVLGDGLAPELGVHNVELNTDPSPLSAAGLAEQVRQLEAARDRGRDIEGRELVLDGMWTLPPGEGTRDYLTDVVVRDGVTVATNMRRSARYAALDNDVLRERGEISVSVPGADRTYPTILPESLATSVQPHVQVLDAAAFPDYFNAAVRTLGPLLSLATNSPLLPADCYPVSAGADLLAATHHELRVAVFEQSINAETPGKVRVPRDLEDAVDLVDRLQADAVRAPFLREWVTDDERRTFTDEFWELDHKRGTYWRWVRPVVGGTPVAGGTERSLRIEFRPLPTQPTVRDNVAFLAVLAGLLRGAVATDHPLASLRWERARESFYAAAHDGPDATLHWVTADGTHTTDREAVYDDLFDLARRGLHEAGLDRDDVEAYVRPVEDRRTAGTPSEWKLARAREALDEGATFREAVRQAGRRYLQRASSGEHFTEW
ncbi:MAG: hypothetical protein ABEJ70_02955 [Halobacteriaceae archaeon]